MQITRIWADGGGGSHFEEVEIEMRADQYAPPAPPFDLSGSMQAESARFFSLAAGWFGDWHPAPRRQLYLNLGGVLEVGVSDGEVRRLGPGDIVLTEDLDGRGHTTRVIGDEPSVGVFIHLASEETGA